MNIKKKIYLVLVFFSFSILFCYCSDDKPELDKTWKDVSLKIKELENSRAEAIEELKNFGN